MNMIKYLRNFYLSFYNETKITVKILLSIIIILYLFAVIIIAFAEKIFADYDTAYFWMNELIICANQMINAGIVPIIFFEIFLHKEKSTS